MSYYKNLMRKHTLATLEKLAEIDGKIRALEADRENYYKPTYTQIMDGLQADREEILKRSKADAEEFYSEYERAVHEAFLPKGAELTDDVAVLKHFTLSESEVKALFSKYEGNYSMQRLIAEYAEKHNISLNNAPVLQEGVYLESGKALLSYFNSALTAPEYKAVFENDGDFAKISAGIME